MPYFSPSSANACPRSLYEKLRGAKKDGGGQPPYQGRWTRIGTAIGDVIQRDILFAEKHYERLTGAKPQFTFERNADGTPMFEDFAKRNMTLAHGGKQFTLFGTCDGIMRYVTEDGEVLRVGLEIKSKQTTAAQTSEYSTRNGPKEDHVKQTVCYSLMYDVDYYVILYVNAAKKAWEMTDEEYAKNRDIKAFGVAITDEMKRDVLDKFAGVVEAAEIGNPPTLDIDKWTFNNFKTACAKSLSDEELASLERQASAILRSSLPDWKKRGPVEAIAKIREIRGGVA
jgi:hypothetical protein